MRFKPEPPSPPAAVQPEIADGRGERLEVVGAGAQSVTLALRSSGPVVFTFPAAPPVTLMVGDVIVLNYETPPDPLVEAVEYRSDPQLVTNPEGDEAHLRRTRDFMERENAVRDAAAVQPTPEQR